MTIHNILIICLLFTRSLFAQNPSQLDSSEKRMLISKLSTLITKHYVFRDKADSISNKLQQLIQEGVYDSISDYKTFSKVLDNDLKKISKDYHFKIWHTPHKPVDKKEKNKRLKNYNQFHNYGISKLEILEGNIGYLKLDYFAKRNKKTYKTALKYLVHSNGIIIDLKDNNGGDRNMVAVLTSYFIKGKKQLAIVKSPNNPTEKINTHRFLTSGRMNSIPMAVLISKRSFSAAEFFAYSMQTLKRAKVIGDTTLGGAHPVEAYVLNDSLSMFMPYAEVINTTTNSNWKKNGVIPDIPSTEFNSLNTSHIYILNELKKLTIDPNEKKYYTKLIAKLSLSNNSDDNR